MPDDWIDRVFAVMALCPQHVFQVLTKRPERARKYLGHGGTCIPIGVRQAAENAGYGDPGPLPLALPNVWLGTSISDQASADKRIPELLACPAAVRFVSAEPLLGPVDLRRLTKQVGGHQEWTDALTGETVFSQTGCIVSESSTLDWVICGGESGPGARVWPGFADAARSLRDQCKAAGVAFFMKQMAGARKSAMPPIPDDLMVREFPDAAR